tara:strand:+ start:815 stop:1027 length:213 start_codon:yes stop_codon:yes gene_type:complete
MKHLKENNETYLSHFIFAANIGLHLVFRGIVFIVHALVPIGNIPSAWNLENLSHRAKTWNDNAESRTKRE